MRRGWWIVLLVGACAVAAPGSLRAEEHDRTADLAKLEPQQLRERLAEAVKEKDYERAERILDVLARKEPGTDPIEGLTADQLRKRLQTAVDNNNHAEAAYLLKALEHKDVAPPNVFGWAIDLAVWTVAVFLVLLFLLGRFAWKPMLQGLEAREKSIATAAEEAKAAQEEAARLRAQMQEDMARANEKVRQTLEEGRRDAARAGEELLAKARADAAAERERLLREMDLARERVLQEVWDRTADVAVAVAARVLPRQLSADDHRRLVDEALTSLGQEARARQELLAGAGAK